MHTLYFDFCINYSMLNTKSCFYPSPYSLPPILNSPPFPSGNYYSFLYKYMFVLLGLFIYLKKFLIFHIWVKSYSISFSLNDLFIITPSRSIHVATNGKIVSFLCIPLYYIYYFFIHPFINGHFPYLGYCK